MRSKKIFIITIALLLIIGTGSFVFAGDGEELDVDNRQNSPTNNITPIQKDDTETKNDSNVGNNTDITIPTIPDEDNNQEERNPSSSNNTNNNINNNGSNSSNNSQVSNNKPSVSNPDETTKPSTPTDPIKPSTPDVEEKPEEKPTEPTTPVTPPTPEDPISKTLEVKNITISNNNGYKKTIDPINVQITFNEPVSNFENVNMGSSSWDKDANTLTIVGITENKKHTIKAYDGKGKYINVDFETRNYFSDEPIINTIVGSDGSIKLVMSSNKEITDPSWTKEDDGTYTKVIDKFEDCDVVIIDGEAIVIPYTPPATLEFKSDNMNENNKYEYTNKAVITFTSVTGKELEPIEGWELSEDRLSISKVVYETIQNKVEVIITDIEGNKTIESYIVLNVDSEIPTLNSLKVISVKPDNKVEVQFTTKILKSIPDGWGKADNKMKKFKKDVDINKEEPVVIIDKWGNVGYYYIKVQIDSSNNANVTQRDATETEIKDLRELYNLN